jgi:hypothetical protein
VDAAEFVCTIGFEPGNKIVYNDAYRRDRDAKGTVNKDGLSWRTISVLARWVRNYGNNIRGEELELLGQHLYNLIFVGKIGDNFKASFRDFLLSTSGPQATPQRFRVELQFHPAARDMADLPWEFLYMPEEEPGGFFLAGQRTDLVLTRLVPLSSSTPQPYAAVGRPLKVLVASCRHRPEAKNDVEKIRARILAMSKSEPILVTEAIDPTFDELCRQIEDRDQPHILHLICHGEPGGLIMKREPTSQAERDAHLIDNDLRDEVVIEGKTVKSLFDKHRPHMVFLHACDGDSPSLTSIFSTAREIAFAAVPAVVAMQYQILVQDALEFVTTFYKKLGEGESIGEAVKEGRRQLALNQQAKEKRQDWSTRLFGTPVVYVKRDQPLITVLPETAPLPTERASEQGGDQRECPRCGKKNPQQSLCCRGCGLQFRCKNCGASYEDPLTDNFCGDCTARVPREPPPGAAGTVGHLESSPSDGMGGVARWQTPNPRAVG